MHSSQNEQDSRHYALAAKLPMLEPADSGECLTFAKYALELSETYDTAVILRVCTRIAHSRSIVETGERTVPPILPYEKNIAKYVMMPGYAKRRHPIVEARTRSLVELADTSPLNSVTVGTVPSVTHIGIVCSGTAYQYVKEVFGDSVSILKLGIVNPLPEKLLLDFAAQVDKLIVVEELDPIIENHCKALGLAVSGKELFPMCDEFTQNLVADALRSQGAGSSVVISSATKPSNPEITGQGENICHPDLASGLCNTVAPGKPDSGAEAGMTSIIDPAQIPARPPVMCAGCPHRGMFYSLVKNKVTVLGDIGCYTLGAVAPLFAIDTTISMGASVSGLHGFTHAQGNEAAARSACVIGDSTFMHSGVTGLINIAYNGSNATVIILDNSITGMTGHQQNPTTGFNIKGDPAGKIDLEALCRAVGINRVRVVDPYNLAECDAAIIEEIAADEPSVIISRRPCVLLKTVKTSPPLSVVSAKCKKCKACMKIGCPAISMTEDGAKIDATLCTGCGVCVQMCRFGAFEG
jgi:indolepyruvate ferredoxin oxidoreductase alpha subunit